MSSLSFTIILSFLLHLSQAVSTLSDVQQIIHFPQACTDAYNTQLTGCDSVTFAPFSSDGQGTCTRACYVSLSSIVGIIQRSCQGIPASSDTVIGHAYTGDLADFLCGKGNYAPSTTSTSSALRTTQSTTSTGTTSNTRSSSIQSQSTANSDSTISSTPTSTSSSSSSASSIKSTSSISTSVSTSTIASKSSSILATSSSSSKSSASHSSSSSTSASAKPQQTQSTTANTNSNTPKDSTPFDQGLQQSNGRGRSVVNGTGWALVALMVAIQLAIWFS